MNNMFMFGGLPSPILPIFLEIPELNVSNPCFHGVIYRLFASFIYFAGRSINLFQRSWHPGMSIQMVVFESIQWEA